MGVFYFYTISSDPQKLCKKRERKKKKKTNAKQLENSKLMRVAQKLIKQMLSQA